MKSITKDIQLLLCPKYNEILVSFLKDSGYAYNFIEKDTPIKSDLLITDHTYLDIINYKFIKQNFKKAICLIPNRYFSLIDNKLKSSNIVFLELPLRIDKVLDELK